MGKGTAGTLGLILAVFVLAQRLSGYQNTPLAVVLTILAGSALAWFAVLWVRDWISRLRARRKFSRTALLEGVGKLSIAAGEAKRLREQLQALGDRSKSEDV